MSTENIPEIMYKELKKPTCPKCKDPLIFDDLGSWYCENPDCKYEEYNNITKCRGECFGNLVLSIDFNFYRLEDKYCQVEDSDGYSCLRLAQAESDQAEAEHWEIMSHKETCNNEECDCRNY